MGGLLDGPANRKRLAGRVLVMVAKMFRFVALFVIEDLDILLL